MQETVNVLATSKKGKSRIGAKLVLAIVEQNHRDNVFVVFPAMNQCRNGVAHRELVQQALWIKKENDPGFQLFWNDEE